LLINKPRLEQKIKILSQLQTQAVQLKEDVYNVKKKLFPYAILNRNPSKTVLKALFIEKEVNRKHPFEGSVHCTKRNMAIVES
jgi:hypothetical protein